MSLPILLAAVSLFAQPEAAPVPADSPPAFLPLGAYLSWERTAANAAHHGIDRWDDVAIRLNALEARHVNLLWVTNMNQKDLPRLVTECEKRGLRLLPSMGAVEAKIDWRWVEGSDYYDKTLPRLMEAAGDSETLVGWVLSDEPHVEDLPRLENLRQRFRALDPDRFCTAVTMWPQTPKVPEMTALPVVCVDLYPFFGPKDPNGPHTDNASKAYYRKNIQRMLDAIGEKPAAGWVMGQCFTEIRGPREYNAQGHLVGLPGAYLHWRAPTIAEMRWQVWETFRGGAKGFICYTLAPEAPKAENATLPAPDVKWKDVLAKEPTDLGPNALTNPDGSVTPQLDELGRVYGQLAPHAALLLRLKRSEEALVEILDDPASVQGFVDPESSTRYVIVVNDDLRETREVVLAFGDGVTGVTDVTGGGVGVKIDTGNEARTATLSLAAGDGVLLGLK